MRNRDPIRRLGYAVAIALAAVLALAACGPGGGGSTGDPGDALTTPAPLATDGIGY